jgi:peroxiredoxin Q/BCP
VKTTLIALALVLFACGEQTGTSSTNSSAAASGAKAAGGALKAGAPAPAIKLQLADGSSVDLASKKGSNVLVYFYPKDDTPGCTVEAQGIRDAWADFKAAGIEVYGVSTQDAASHTSFSEKHNLPFPLVVDVGGEVAKAFGVPLKNGLAARQSFLIGKDGNVKAVWESVSPDEHAKDVLKAAAP